VNPLARTLRRLGRRPASSSTAVVILAVGLGVGVSLCSIIRTLFGTPLPVRDPAELVGIFNQDARGRDGLLSLPDLRELRVSSRTLEGLAGFIQVDLALDAGDGPLRVPGQVVTKDYFEVLDLPGIRGTGLSAADPPGDPRVVVSHGLWRQAFGGAPGLVGHSVRVNGVPFVVTGVAPPGFTGTVPSAPVEAWVSADLLPIVMPGFDPALKESRKTQWLIGLGRLRHGISLDRASRELTWLHGRREEPPENGREWHLAVVPGRFGTWPPADHANVARLMRLSALGTALLLAVVCANVSMLLLVRLTERRQELGVRQVLGAGRSKLVSLALQDTLVLCTAGGLLGLALAPAVRRALALWAPPGSAFDGVSPAVGLAEIAFAALLALGVAVVCTLAPALSLIRMRAGAVLAEVPAGGVSARHRTVVHRVFSVGQIALAVLLLSGGALLFTSYARLAGTDLGFDTEGLLAGRLDAASSGIGAGSWSATYDRVHWSLEQIPGVEAAALAFTAPLGHWRYSRSLVVPGRPMGDAGFTDTVSGNLVTPGYFRTLGLDLLAGRDFTSRDGPDAPAVAVVSRSLAAELWPPGRAVGERFRLWSPGGDFPEVEVVGVVADSRQGRSVSEKGGSLYLPLAQSPVPAATVLVRGDGSFTASATAVREAVRRAAPGLLLFDLHSFHDRIGRSLAVPRSAAFLLMGLGGLSLTLALVGLYGLLSSLWARRTREIGVRIALGARRRDLLTLVARQWLVLTGSGIVLGLLPSAPLERWLLPWLEAPATPAPLRLSMIALSVAAVAAVSMVLPAWRVVRTDPRASLEQR